MPIAMYVYIQLQKRGVWPDGSGQVIFSCPVVRKMKPLLLVDEGRVRKFEELRILDCQLL